MEILGLFGGEISLSVATIQSKLKRNGHDLAYTTVMTVLLRLHQKGHLSRKKKAGNSSTRRRKKVAGCATEFFPKFKALCSEVNVWNLFLRYWMATKI